MAAGHSPLEQFAIKRFIELDVGGVDFSFTNASAMMVLAVLCIMSFILLGTRRHALVPNRWQSMVELSYELIAKSVRDNIGTEGRPFFPLVFSLFMFILFCFYGLVKSGLMISNLMDSVLE